MVNILQGNFPNAFCQRKSFIFCFTFHWSLFLRAEMTKKWALDQLAHCALVTPYEVKRFWWTLGQPMAYCLTAPSHYLNQCCPAINTIMWHSFLSDVYLNTQDINPQVVFEIDTFVITAISHRGQWVKSLRPSDAIWRHRSGSILAQLMACCLTAPSHYLNQCWLIINKV